MSTRLSHNRWLRKVVPHALLAVCSVAHAQQDPQYTMYMWNTSAVNPGHAGSADALSASLLAREQWVGLPGAPSTRTLAIHSPLAHDALGAGLSVVHDRLGPISNTMVYGDVAYRLRLTAKAKLAFGLKAGFDLQQADLQGLSHVDPTDPMFQQDLNAKALPNFGFGVYYHGQRSFVGASAPRLLERSTDRSMPSGSASAAQARHFFLIAGHVFELGPNVDLRPWVLLKATKGSPLSTDANAAFLVQQRLWIGAGYRYHNSANGMLGYQLTQQLRAAYAYDLALGRLQQYQGGTHEIMIGYDLRNNRKGYLSPRYF
jgi:type IX secretion system PorP/SprF family membrane protein